MEPGIEMGKKFFRLTEVQNALPENHQVVIESKSGSLVAYNNSVDVTLPGKLDEVWGNLSGATYLYDSCATVVSKSRVAVGTKSFIFDGQVNDGLFVIKKQRRIIQSFVDDDKQSIILQLVGYKLAEPQNGQGPFPIKEFPNFLRILPNSHFTLLPYFWGVAYDFCHNGENLMITGKRAKWLDMEPTNYGLEWKTPVARVKCSCCSGILRDKKCICLYCQAEMEN